QHGIVDRRSAAPRDRARVSSVSSAGAESPGSGAQQPATTEASSGAVLLRRERDRTCIVNARSDAGEHEERRGLARVSPSCAAIGGEEDAVTPGRLVVVGPVHESDAVYEA